MTTTTAIAVGAIFQLGGTRLMIFPDGSANIVLGDADPLELAPRALADLADLCTLLSNPMVQATIDRCVDQLLNGTPKGAQE